MNIKAQAQVISTILLILLAISVAAVIMAFVIPFVRNQLSSSDCFDVADKLEITNHPQYTCYDDSNSFDKNMFVQVRLKDTDKILGFTIELGGPSTETFKIKEGESTAGVGMYKQVKGDPLELPGQNQERTYNISRSEIPQLIRIYPIIEGDKTCSESSSITTVNDCFII